VVGNIIPIYKNKGDSNDPKNFRPITLVSCLGKLFTAILSERLSKYSDNFFVMHENQCGFRQGYCTVDNLFTLYSFFELLKRKKKKMYCAFIYFEKAFDKIWREGLWYKLLINNINGKMLHVIQNIYKDIKSNISYSNSKSDYFPCSIFFNNLEDFLENHNVTGLFTISQDIENIMNVYMNIFLLLYADDTVLMAETPEDLQKQLNIFHDYCLAWKLKANIDKTKIVCFINGRLPQNLQFTYSNSEIEIVKEFNYLGLLLTKTGNFKRTIKTLADKGTKAMYEILKRGIFHNLSISCRFDLFDKVVKPILL
jgi:hypothetical protein